MTIIRDWLLWGLMMTIMVTCAITAGAFAFILLTRYARAHTAPTGWSYPLSCCSGMDCGEISGAKVQELPTGYRVTIDPGDHQMVIQHTVYDVPYDDARIKDSPDGVYHICIGQQFAREGRVDGGRLICFFVPPKGF